MCGGASLEQTMVANQNVQEYMYEYDLSCQRDIVESTNFAMCPKTRMPCGLPV